MLTMFVGAEIGAVFATTPPVLSVESGPVPLELTAQTYAQMMFPPWYPKFEINWVISTWHSRLAITVGSAPLQSEIDSTNYPETQSKNQIT